MTNDNMFQQMSDEEVLDNYRRGVAAAFQIPERYLRGTHYTSMDMDTSLAAYFVLVQESISMCYDHARRACFDGRPVLLRYGLPMETDDEILLRLYRAAGWAL